MTKQPKILILDIESKPIIACVWGLFDQNIGLNQILEDWSIIAWAAHWYGDPPEKIMYMDNRHKKDLMDDRQLVKGIAKLINEADIVIGQNVKAFDIRKINARAVINGLPPIKGVLVTDIMREGRKVFGFTSHKLAYTTETLNKKYKKLTHAKFPGFDLWAEVMKGNQAAWKEMEIYCKHDVLSTEEQYTTIHGWIKTQNLAAFESGGQMRCRCGSLRLKPRGFAHTESGKYQVYHCSDCGKWPRGSINLLTTDHRINRLREVR